MAQPIPPGDIVTQPDSKMTFNAPFDFKITHLLKVINNGSRRIGWIFKTTNLKRVVVDPPCGVLDPNESVLVSVSCGAFTFGPEDANNDRIVIEWVNSPDGATKQFSLDWLELDGIKRRKNFAIEYNP